MRQVALISPLASALAKLAGPTFTLLPDDGAAGQALSRIAAHLAPAGAALVPLWVPEPTPASELGVTRSSHDERAIGIGARVLAGAAVQTAHVPDKVAGAVLVGVDLGPNLSVTGSLATILWLTAIRREGQDVGFWRFLKLGLLVMPPALLLALAGLLLV